MHDGHHAVSALSGHSVASESVAVSSSTARIQASSTSSSVSATSSGPSGEYFLIRRHVAMCSSRAASEFVAVLATTGSPVTR